MFLTGTKLPIKKAVFYSMPMKLAKSILTCLLALTLVLMPPVLLLAAPVADSDPAEAHESELKLIQELNDTVGQLNGEIADQQKMLAEATTDKERQMIEGQIKTLEKHKATLQRLVGELTGELEVKGVPVKEVLAEQLKDKRERLEQERERIVTERREVEVAEGSNL
jgi:ABC-type transport system involved in cytochrome bd biosynthesis fused ATPase/permease subunit